MDSILRIVGFNNIVVHPRIYSLEVISLYFDRIILLCYYSCQETLQERCQVGKTSEDKVQTTIYLPKSVHTELRIKALREHVSMTKLIIRAILNELQVLKEEKKTDS